ncbi:MAG: ABC transporter ATP-binding protein [Acidimicrobiia bacterium]
MLELRTLTKRFGDVVALDGCSFTVERGQVLGFVGPNGAGKTTAMRSVFSLVRPDDGAVTWDGAAIGAATRLRFGYMPEQRGLYARMRVAQQLVYFGKLHGMNAAAALAAADRWLEQFGLSDRKQDRLEALSHGNQQRVQLAAALIHDPVLLVLDEPFSGLDPLGVTAMAGVLAEQATRGTAVMFSSHQLDLVEDLCEAVVVIDHGAVVLSGPVRTLRARSPLRYLSVETEGGGTGWVDDLPSATIIERDGDRVVMTVPHDTDLGVVVRAASGDGAVRQLSFEPPNLSQVFRDAVGR